MWAALMADPKTQELVMGHHWRLQLASGCLLLQAFSNLFRKLLWADAFLGPCPAQPPALIPPLCVGVEVKSAITHVRCCLAPSVRENVILSTCSAKILFFISRAFSSSRSVPAVSCSLHVSSSPPYIKNRFMDILRTNWWLFSSSAATSLWPAQ